MPDGQGSAKVNRKSVLIVEDHTAQREALKSMLTSRGFDVASAGTAAEVRRLTEESAPEYDVVMLDMRLDDPEEPDTTGADLGIEIRSSRPQWPPEFLIHSAYAEVDYYKLAFNLGAAAYLSKVDSTTADLRRYIRVLSLLHGLRLERPGAAEQIRLIAETSRNGSEAISRFCREALAPEFVSCLGAPFAVLLTSEDGTQCCANNCDIPEGALPVYSLLQALIKGQINNQEPFIVDTRITSRPMSGLDLDVFRRFEGAAFLPLSIGRDICLSVGVLKEQANHPFAEDPVALARVLAQNIRPAVFDYLLNLQSSWTEITSNRNAMLRATAQLCLYVGQEQQAIVSDLAYLQEGNDLGAPLQKLYTLADDILQTGEILAAVVGDDRGAVNLDVGEARYQNVYIAEIIRLAASEVIPEDSISIHGDFEMQAVPDLLQLAASRLLQWFANRAIETTFTSSPTIEVRCETTNDGLEVTFEDQSHRLSGGLRRRMFSPYTQPFPPPATSGKITGPGLHLPLFLAKILIEVNHRGILEDRSDELEGEVGHRFVVRFPLFESFDGRISA